MNPLYKEHLIELYAEKKNFGELRGKTHEATMSSPSCSDIISMELKVENGIIVDAKFRGAACFVSTVSSEVITENIKGMRFEDLQNLTKADLDRFLGTEVIETRIGCELFPLEVLKNVKPVEANKK